MINTENKVKTLVSLCLLTGTLDAMAALLIGYKVSPAVIFQFIASGWFGKAAFAGGTAMVLWGILFHYLIASAFSIVFFILYPGFIQVLKNKYLTGVVFGLMTWAIMNLAVLPLTNIPKRAGGVKPLSLIEGIVALIIAIGIPVAVITERYYRKRLLRKTLDV
ncbi:hypothetical protein [Mucilaginibacter ginsenosidivorans]|uniref:DUF1440 domain-containing protein n=1 Tax=Mucilaginibacter ginsenosidivorans TaxID=398053 RepID=A0A5B8UYD5_9SPHI|nr:hypothetical protein [Mucilaginibacter ginsenosidivorans]QEC63928.1 hypothetical protein FRZ54_15540 [Mucilaginibacter ginsenosidivorans]